MIAAFLRLLYWLGEVDCPPKPVAPTAKPATDPELLSNADCIRADWCRRDNDAEGYAFWMLSAAGFTREIKTTYHRN